jgi:hypothetical protein
MTQRTTTILLLFLVIGVWSLLHRSPQQVAASRQAPHNEREGQTAPPSSDGPEMAGLLFPEVRNLLIAYTPSYRESYAGQSPAGRGK